MNELAALLDLDGLSIAIGVIVGFVCAVLLSRLSRGNVLKQVSEHLSDEVKNLFEGITGEMKSSFGNLSSEALNSNQERFLNLANDKFTDQTQQHSSELESKKELIDQQLQQMSETLKTVPTELEKSQTKVADVLDKSTANLKESNQNYLNQLTEKSETQTKEHNKELDSKKELIDQRLSDMDVKLGKVERLVQDLQTDRKAQYSALDEQLKSLTSTTSSLQNALADNRARGQWGERMAEDMLNFMGLVEGVNYIKQSAIEAGTKPDFTFRLPNDKSLNMDAKFPLDNYLRYVNAENEAERKEFSQKFLRDVNQRIGEIQKRDYIAAETVDFVLIFIPNEQVYRFIHEQDETIIDGALRQKVILCSPLTLYIVLALINQASRHFFVEQRSREIFAVVDEIRSEWSKYTEKMRQLENTFGTMQKRFHELTFTRTRALDRRFGRIEGLLESSEMDENPEADIPLLSDENV